MATCFYAFALQEKAQLLILSCNTSQEEVEEETHVATYFDAVTSFRKAAGIYQYIAKSILPYAISRATTTTTTTTESCRPSDLPLECRQESLDVLAAIALAQAQSTAADRAERKHMSPTTLASLHHGAVDLYESAASLCKSHFPSMERSAPSAVHPRVRMWLAFSSELSASKARRAQAAMYREQDQLGMAVRCLLHAKERMLRTLSSVAVAKEERPWAGPLRGELHSVDQALDAYDKERTIVHVQAIAPSLPLPPVAKCIVTPLQVESISLGSLPSTTTTATPEEYFFSSFM